MGATAMASTATNTPQQLAFLDPADAPPLPRLAILGRIERLGEVRIGTDGSAHLVVEVLQPGDGLPFMAVMHVPASERSMLEARARRLIPGIFVMVVGRGLEVTDHRGREVLFLKQCDSVTEKHLDELAAEYRP